MNSRNATIDRLKANIANVEKEREQTKYLKQQVKNFTDTLQMVKEKEVIFFKLFFLLFLMQLI